MILGPAAFYADKNIKGSVRHEDCMIPKAGLEVLVKRKFPASVENRTSASSSLYSVSYLDYKLLTKQTVEQPTVSYLD